MYEEQVKESNTKLWSWTKESLDDRNLFDTMMNTCIQRNLVWVNWHNQISRKKEELTVEEVYEDEKNAGIDYLKALSNE